MSAAEPPAEGCADMARFQHGTANASTGPEVQLLWFSQQQTVDEQLANAADKLILAKRARDAKQASSLAAPTAFSLGAGGNAMTKGRRKKVAERAAAKIDALKQARDNADLQVLPRPQIFILEGEPRYEEMARFLAQPGEEKTQEHSHGMPTSKPEPPGTDWLSEFRLSLDGMLVQLSMTADPRMCEEQLKRTYAWFQTHRNGPKNHAGHAASDRNFLEHEIDKPRPGSAFYVVPREDHYESIRHDSEGEVEKLNSAADDDRSMASRLTSATLPPARDRLRDFQTKQISPLTARRLKTYDDCQGRETTERPFTPSTCTGGSYTARSSMSARSTPTPLGPFSARSSPTPLGSRPSSAVGSSCQRPLTAQGIHHRGDSATMRLPASVRPVTAPRLGTRPPTLPAAQSSGADRDLTHEALDHQFSEQQMAIAMQNMEERWLLKRHRDIANQMVDEERHAAIAAWAERRARVEEEISYNAEAMRFQSELLQRATTMPTDAEQDIAATVPADQELGDSPHSNDGAAVSSATPAAGVVVSAQRQTPRYDVSQMSDKADEQQVVSAAAASKQPDMLKSDRIANLRRINRRLLRASEAAEEGDMDDLGFGDDDGAPESIFQTEVSYQHVSLSAYTADSTQALVPARNRDDADVVAEVCDHWSQHNEQLRFSQGKEMEVGTGANLHELRFKQMQEAEAVKRVLARRNCPFNAAVVDSALVMPSHFLKPDACIFNTEPNLQTPNMPDWYIQEKKKKDGRRKKAPRASVAARRRPNNT